MLAVVASMGGFIFGVRILVVIRSFRFSYLLLAFQYDTGQISDILLMDDFLLRFAHCDTAGLVSSCSFSQVRSGLIVSLLSIGTLGGVLVGATWVSSRVLSNAPAAANHDSFFLVPLTNLVVDTL